MYNVAQWSCKQWEVNNFAPFVGLTNSGHTYLKVPITLI